MFLNIKLFQTTLDKNILFISDYLTQISDTKSGHYESNNSYSYVHSNYVNEWCAFVFTGAFLEIK